MYCTQDCQQPLYLFWSELIHVTCSNIKWNNPFFTAREKYLIPIWYITMLPFYFDVAVNTQGLDKLQKG